MNKIKNTLKAIRSPKTNTPLAIAAVVLAAILGAFGLIVDAGTITNVLLVVVPLIGGALQHNTKELTESVDEEVVEDAAEEEEAPVEVAEETPVAEEAVAEAPVEEPLPAEKTDAPA